MDDLKSWREALKAFTPLHDIFDGFERYLIPDSAKSLGVAVSGGGDSVALLCLLHLWGRPLEVFCVDHGLNPLSANWCAQVEALARRLGHGFSKIDWVGDKPSTGIQAAARQARHRLLANAARARDIAVLCLGHNHDDIREARLMRQMGSSVGAPVPWSPSPVWPQGRGVFIYRPLLNVPRQVLRDWLTAIGVSWVDDPANDNPKYLRSRARAELNDAVLVAAVDRAANGDLSGLILPLQVFEREGILTLSLPHILNLEASAACRVIAAGMVSAGGGQRLPRTDSVRAIYDALLRGAAGPFILSGARLMRVGDVIHIGREHGDMVRRKVGACEVAAHAAAMWDGRFEITTRDNAVSVMAAQGLKGLLTPSGLARYLQVPAGLRGALPVVKTGWETGNGLVLLSESDNSAGVALRSWVVWRFYAALGLMKDEADLLW